MVGRERAGGFVHFGADHLDGLPAGLFFEVGWIVQLPMTARFNALALAIWRPLAMDRVRQMSH